MVILPPGLILVLGGLLLPLLPRGWLRQGWLVLVPLLAIAQLVAMPAGFMWQWEVFGWRLFAIRADGLSFAFGYVFGLGALLGSLYLMNVRDLAQKVAALVYAGAAMSAVYAGDLVTLFIFWELTAVASAFLIWTRRTNQAWHIGLHYLLVQVVSGLLLLGGILALQTQGETLTFEWIGLDNLAGWLIFTAFAIKGAFPFLHAWLTESYPEATDAGTVIMSLFTTKLAMYALIRGYAGIEILVWIGVVGAVYATLRMIVENDAKRVVCWALIVQLGLITSAIGAGTTLALTGAAMHAFAGVFYIGLMMMALGVVHQRTGTMRLDQLGGLFRHMPTTAMLFMVGAASLAAVPGFAGYVSKLLLFDALADAPTGVYAVLQTASVLTFVFAGVRLTWAIFFGVRPDDSPVTEADSSQTIAMTVAAVLCVLFALAPGQFLVMLPGRVTLEAWTLAQVGGQLLTLGTAALVAGIVWWLGWLKRPPVKEFLDVDWLYRVALPRAIEAVMGVLGEGWERLLEGLATRGRQIFETILRTHGPEGVLARTWATGSMALWMAFLLAIALILYYL